MSDNIHLDFGDPDKNSGEMVLTIILPVSYDPDKVSKLLDQAANLRENFIQNEQ